MSLIRVSIPTSVEIIANPAFFGRPDVNKVRFEAASRR
jgi:hypothetical protein